MTFERIDDHVTFGAVLDGVVQVEFLGYPNSGQHVVRAVGMDAATHLTAYHRNQSIQLEVRLRCFGRVGLGCFETVGVDLCLVQCTAHHRSDTHAGHRTLFVGTVATLRVFAGGKFHLFGSRNDHFLCALYIAQFDDDAGAADDVGRTGQDANGGKSGFPHL